MWNFDEENPEAQPFTEYLTKDSGVKSVHSDGVQRDTQQGKTLYPLMFPRGVPMKEQLLVRVAELYTRGAEKYGGRNWENSRAEDTLEHHLEALWRHFMNFYFDVQDQEDHAAAIVWNINAVELTRRYLREALRRADEACKDDSDADADELLRRLEDGGVPTEVAGHFYCDECQHEFTHVVHSSGIQREVCPRCGALVKLEHPAPVVATERENPIVTILKDIHNKRLSDEP